MLGKLIKNEFKATCRLIGTLLICMLAVGGMIFVNGKIGESSSAFAATQAILETGQIWILIASPFVILGFLVFRFYKSMLGDEGYLSFTLPVTTGELILSKWLVAFAWMIVTVVVMLVSLVISNGTIVNAVKKVLEEVNTVDGVSGTMFLICLSVIVNFAYMLIVLYTSMAFGQLFSNHKIIGSVLGYFLIDNLIGIVSVAVLGVTDNLDVDVELVNLSQIGETLKLLNTTQVIGIVENIIFAALGFLLCRYLLKNHLNLE